MDDTEDMEDLELLEKTLDEVMLRSPISPDKAWEYYRLSFGEDHATAVQAKHGPNVAGNLDSQKIDHGLQSEERACVKDCKTEMRESPKLSDSRCRRNTESAESKLSGLSSSPITITDTVSTRGGLNENLAGKQLTAPSQPDSGAVSQKADLSCDTNTSSSNTQSLLFTTHRNIKAARPQSLATLGHGSVCLPLTVEKVKPVTAGEGNNPIDIHGETFPYADECESTDTLLQNSASGCDKRFACSNIDITNGATNGSDSAMYRYGYSSHSDNGFRPYSSSSNSSSSYRSPTLSQRSSFSRPTMISSLSPMPYSNRSRDTSYTSSSLRRSTSVGNDRPYYRSGSSDYSTGSRLHYDYSSPRTGVLSPVTYRKTYTSGNVSVSNSEDKTKDTTDGKDSVSNVLRNSTDSNLVSGEDEKSSDVLGTSPGSNINSRYGSYTGITSNNNNNTTRTEPITKSGASSSNRLTDSEGYKKVSGRVYINMNYERCDPSEKTAQQRTSTEQVMRPSNEKKTSSESTQSVNLLGDGPCDKTKVVSQVKLNTSHERQKGYTYNRQIWSRPVDSTNISSDNNSESEDIGRSEVLQPGPIILKDSKPGERTFQNIDLKVKATEDKCGSTEASENKRTFRDSYGYCSHLSPDLTAKPPWYSTMGANVQSTHSSASSNDDTDSNMESSSRRRDNRDRYRGRHKNAEDDYVLTESTASFVFRNGQWVPEGGAQENTTSNQKPETVTSTYTVPPLSSTNRINSTSSDTRRSESPTTRGTNIPYRSMSQSSAGSVSPSRYESASSMPDSPVVSKSQFYSRGDNSARHEDRHSDNAGSGHSDNTAMNLYTERMNIISGFDRQDKAMDRERPEQTVVTEKLHISMSPPTFTVGGSGDNIQNSGRDSSKNSASVDNCRNSRLSDGRENFKSTGESWYRSDNSSGGISSNRGTKEPPGDGGSMETAAKTNIQSYHTPYYVTEPPEEEIKRNDCNNSNSSSGSEKSQSDYNTILFIDENDSREATVDDSDSMGAQLSSSASTSGTKLDKSQTRAEQGLFLSNPGASESRRGPSNRERLDLPAGVINNTTGSSDSKSRPYSSGNVNTENYTTSSAGSSQVNKTSLKGTDRHLQRAEGNQVSRGGTDVRGRDQDTLCIGEKSSVSTNERIDTISTTQRPESTTQLKGNSSDRESLAQDDGKADSTRDTRGFSELESMSNNQISERRGGIYYNENVSRRNVTGILASDHEDRRRALALSQTETQRSGEMVQTNDRSEVRQTHAGQIATRKAAGVEVSKDGDRVRSRDVTDTVDRNRTDTEYKSETPLGLEVSKVREDRHTHSHQDRQVQSEIQKDGREVRQSSSSKSESAQVSRVTESGDSRVSQRQERHFKSSKVTKSSRTSGSGFSRDGFSHKAVGFGSDDSDNEDWPQRGSRSRDSGDGSAISTRGEVDRYTGRHSDSDNDGDEDKDEPYRETIVHENKAAEVLTNTVSRTDKEGTISLAEQRQRGLLDRGVTRNISEDGNITTQRVQQRQQVQSARRTASSSYSRTSGNSQGDSGTVSAEDEAVILAALLGRLEEKEVAPFSPSEHLSRQASAGMGSESGAVVPLVRNTEDVEGEENLLSPEEQSRAIAQARLEFQARQAKVRRPVARKRTIIVDEEMMEEMFLRCIICRDRYDTDEKAPKLLPCHHTFCLECLREMYRVESEHRQTLTTVYRDSAPSFVTIHCPTCRASHMITDKEFKSYKSDHKLLELLEISASPSKGNLGYCKTHRTQVTDHFCESCLQAVCSDCKVLDHREQDDHVVHSRAEALKIYANQAFITTHAVDSEDRKLEEMEKKLSGALDVINTKLSTSEQQIRQTFDKFKVAINNRQDHLLEKIENEMGSRREEFSGDLGEITKRLETIEKTQTTTKQAQEDEDVEQMFTAHQNAREMFKNNFEPVTGQKSNIKSSFHYDKRERVNIMNTVSDHGMITFMS